MALIVSLFDFMCLMLISRILILLTLVGFSLYQLNSLVRVLFIVCLGSGLVSSGSTLIVSSFSLFAIGSIPRSSSIGSIPFIE